MTRDQFDNADLWRVVGRACDAFFARMGITYAPHIDRRVKAAAIANKARHARNRLSGGRTYVRPVDPRAADFTGGVGGETRGEISAHANHQDWIDAVNHLPEHNETRTKP